MGQRKIIMMIVFVPLTWKSTESVTKYREANSVWKRSTPKEMAIMVALIQIDSLYG